jgi:hypothetical protein
MTRPRLAPLAGEVARRPVLASGLMAGQLLVPWRVLGQLLPVPWRLLMLLSALAQQPVAPARLRRWGQEQRQWLRVIAGVPVYSPGLLGAAESRRGSWSGAAARWQLRH